MIVAVLHPPSPPQVLAVTMVDDDQPIICDAFSSTGDATISGNPSSGVNTDEGNNAGAAAGAIIAVIVAGRVGMVVLAGATATPSPSPAPLPLHPPPPRAAGRFGRSWLGRQRLPATLNSRLPPSFYT